MSLHKRANCPGDALLVNALDADSRGNFEIAYEFYERGITYYLQVRLVNEANSSVQAMIRHACHEHLKRAEVLKCFLETRNIAKQNISNAEIDYKRLDYTSSYPKFMTGIEKLLECAQLIKPSHPQLSNELLGEVARYMTLAEEINKLLRPTPSQTEILLQKTSAGSTNENKIPLNSNSNCDTEYKSSRISVASVDRDDEIQDSDKRFSKKAELEVCAMYLRQRIDALLTESNLLLDYLKLDSQNEEKLLELELVMAQIGEILGESDDNGYIVKEYSADREKLELSLASCEDFLSSPFNGTTKVNDQKGKENTTQRVECLICCENIAVMATVPCGHKILCQDCVTSIGDKLDTCYICKTTLKDPKCIKIYD